MEQLKENINTILLVAITLMVSYDVFLKNDSQIVYQKGNNRAAINKQPAQQQQQQQFQQPQQQQPFEGATTTINNTQQQPPLPENAQNTNPPTAMAFAETSHDFGAINQDSKHTKVFEFKNTGDKPLLIALNNLFLREKLAKLR